MTKNEIRELMNDAGEPCVSIIIPMHRLSNDRRKDVLVVKHIIDNAKTYLKQNYAKSNSHLELIIENIDKLVESIDYTHSQDGIGIFVSPRISKMVKLPFQVTEKIKVGEKFDCRDLLYYLNSILDYLVLSVSKEHVHLFSGKGEELHEIKNEDFPIEYVEKFEYEKSNRANSFNTGGLQTFEHDKSVMEESRVISFLRTADHKLEKYVNSHIPIIISGGKKEIADYLEITQHLKKIIGKVEGIHHTNAKMHLGNLAWELVQKSSKDQYEKLIENLHELIGKQLLAVGVEEVWAAAMEGKGLELVVEKDFEGHAYLSIDGLELKLKRPAEIKKYIYVADAVERIIKNVVDKSGNIVFVDNDTLKDFNGVALQLRYTGVQY